MQTYYERYRIYPTREQQIQIQAGFDASRFVWNYCVEKWNEHKFTTITTKQMRADYPWLKQSQAAVIQTTLKDFQRFITQFLNKNRKIKYNKPKFKIKGACKNSFRVSNQLIKIDYIHSKIWLQKLYWIKCIYHRFPERARLLNGTIIKDKDGKYYISCCFERANLELYSKTNKSIGVDLGIKEFITTSNGLQIGNPNYIKTQQHKIKKLQQHLARKQHQSKRREKCRLRLAKAHSKIVRQRKNFINNITTFLIQEFDTINIEDLNVTDMRKTKFIARNLVDASFYEFKRQLTYKCSWYGKTLNLVDRWYPSSKTCSECGYVKEELSLSERIYNCKECGHNIDRDLNAAINILKYKSEKLPDYSRGEIIRLEKVNSLTDLAISMKRLEEITPQNVMHS
jgi:putative transposase